MKIDALLTFTVSLLGIMISDAGEISGRFAPPQGKVLIFAGQDNASIGGTKKHRDGYVENVGIPAGVSHYVHLSAGWTNELGHSFPDDSVAGLKSETDWGAGPMHLQAYLDSPMLDRCIVHLSISLANQSEKNIADGEFDQLIGELVTFVSKHREHPFLIRIGHEFGTPGNRYDPDNFQKAFRRIVNALRVDKLPNVAIVYASSTGVKAGQFEEYDPGSEYYDWVGYSWWGGENDGRYALEFARKIKKPVFITETTPLGHYFNRDDPEKVWTNWFVKFFAHVEENIDVVRALSYINSDWDAREMWEGWGMTKIETSPEILRRWRQKMNEPRFLNSADKPFSHIGFPAPFRIPEKAPVEPYAKYKDPEQPVANRVDDLLGRMTLEEKVAQLGGWWEGDERTLRRTGEIFTKDFYAKIAPHGVGAIGPVNLGIEEDIRQYHAIQEYFLKHTRLGVPALRYVEASHGLMRFEATSFPSPIALSCSWNTDLVEKIYRHVASESRSRGIFQVLSPNISLTRDPRWGRTDETLGEDPFLAGRLGAAIIRGFQGQDTAKFESQHVASTLKHFAGMARAVGGRNRAPYVGGKRQLLDFEIEPFRYILRTNQPMAIMPGLNEVDGLPCHINPWLLKDTLRDKLGFEGLIVSDYHALQSIREYQGIGESDPEVATRAIDSGLQMDLPDSNGFRHLPQLLEEKKVELSQIDLAVRAVLDLKFRLGLFNNPRLSFHKATELTKSGVTRKLAIEAARESIVLLKNEGALPLDRHYIKKLAVIGPNSDVCRLGSRSGTPHQSTSLLDGIKTFLGEKVEVIHAKGCMIALNDTHDSYLNWRHVNDVNFVSVADNQPLIDEAVEVSKRADAVILALGENSFLGRETWGTNHLGDRSTLKLTESQQKLAEDVLATGKPVILYLIHGRPIALGKLGDRFKAILTGHYTGQESGTAAAEVLFGETNPSGKLTVSWPRSAGHLPSNYNLPRSASTFDYIDSPLSATYPFGHGLSYTSFSYSGPALSKDQISPGETVEVSFQLSNSGSRQGAEIAQLYVSGERFPLVRPRLELKGFQRVTLEPGESRTITFQLDADDLAFHDTQLNRTLPKGQYRIMVGASSASLSDPVILKTGPAKPAGREELPEPPDPPEKIEPEKMDLSKTPTEKETPPVNPPVPEDIPEVSASLVIAPEHIRQTIDGFGGSIAFRGTEADDEALQIAINGLSTSIIRAQGEVSPEGDPEHNRDVLQRAMKINPGLKVLLTFWQPKSVSRQETDYWLNKIDLDGVNQFELKKEREAEWAFEVISRIKQYRDWGINVTTIAVQNESGGSSPGTITCRWEPERLADFIENKIRPGFDASKLDGIKIAAPDLAFIGQRGSEIDRFIPVLTSRAVDVATYHMNDRFNDGVEDKTLAPLKKNGKTLADFRNPYFPEKSLWMTDTTGAQWNSADWHTYGWTEGMTGHDKAIKAAGYLHTALVEAGANAFLWKGLISSSAPESETNPRIIEKHRDEGLILVADQTVDGRQKFLERTGKFYAIRQFSGFVKPGYRRLHIDSPENLQLSAFLSTDKSMVVCVAINDTLKSSKLSINEPEEMKLIGSFQTDKDRKCSPVDNASTLPPRSIRTLVYSK